MYIVAFLFLKKIKSHTYIEVTYNTLICNVQKLIVIIIVNCVYVKTYEENI